MHTKSKSIKWYGTVSHFLLLQYHYQFKIHYFFPLFFLVLHLSIYSLDSWFQWENITIIFKSNSNEINYYIKKLLICANFFVFTENVMHINAISFFLLCYLRSMNSHFTRWIKIIWTRNESTTKTKKLVPHIVLIFLSWFTGNYIVCSFTFRLFYSILMQTTKKYKEKFCSMFSLTSKV